MTEEKQERPPSELPNKGEEKQVSKNGVIFLFNDDYTKVDLINDFEHDGKKVTARPEQINNLIAILNRDMTVGCTSGRVIQDLFTGKVNVEVSPGIFRPIVAIDVLAAKIGEAMAQRKLHSQLKGNGLILPNKR